MRFLLLSLKEEYFLLVLLLPVSLKVLNILLKRLELKKNGRKKSKTKDLKGNRKKNKFIKQINQKK